MYDLVNVKPRRNTKNIKNKLIIFILFIIYIFFFISEGRKNVIKNQEKQNFLQVASYNFSVQIEAEKNIKQKQRINEISSL